MNQLIDITESTCVNHLKALRNVVLTDEELRHRNCSGEDKYCPSYLPVKGSELRFGYLRLYQRRENEPAL